MKYEAAVNPRDAALIASRLNDFVPAEVYDIHAHQYHPDHFLPQTR
jgi:hypothetical protein